MPLCTGPGWTMAERGAVSQRKRSPRVCSASGPSVQARVNALRAVELDGSLAEGHLALAWVRGWFDWDWEGADRELQRAMELRPNEPTVHFRKGSLACDLGRFDEALEELRKAQVLDPVSPIIPTLIGETYRRSGRPDLAIEELRKAEAMDPEFGPPHYKLGEAYEEKGMYEAAMAEFVKCMAAFGYHDAEKSLRRALEKEGPMGAYRAFLMMDVGSPETSAYRMAQTYEVLGQRDQALAALEKGLELRTAGIYAIAAEPAFANLRGERRFQNLLRRMNLPRQDRDGVARIASGLRVE